MPKTFTFELVTPERPVLESEAELAVLPAYEGEMGVLPGHLPYIVQLMPGEIRLTQHGQVRRLAVSGGFAEVARHKVSVFAETAEMADAIDAERALQALERAKAETARKDIDPLMLAQAEAALRRAQVRLRVAEKKGVSGGHSRAPSRIPESAD